MNTDLHTAARWLTGMTALGLALGTAADAPKPSRVAFEFLTGETSRKVIIELDEGRAPQTCANFLKLVESGYYQGMAVHRVIPNYLVQMGDPYTREPGKKHLWGTGGPDYTIPSEFGGKHVRGAVAMARLPNAQNPRRESSGSQFYVALDDLSQLDGDYTVFGKVVRGIEHLDYMSQLTADTNDVPVTRVAVHRTGIGEEIRSSSPLAERAVKPVAAAAEGLKDVSKAVASNLPLLKGKDEPQPARSPAEEKKQPQPAPRADSPVSPPASPAASAAKPVPVSSPAVAPPPLPAKIASEVPAPATSEPASMPGPDLESEQDRPKWPLLAKLAPSKLAILGKKKEEQPEGESLHPDADAPEQTATQDGEKKPLLPFLHKKKSSEAIEPEPATGISAPAATAAAKPTAEPAPATTPAPADASEKDKEPKDGQERKGFLGRMLDKVRPGGS